MVEQFVLQEIMELNTEMSTMTITTDTNTSLEIVGEEHVAEVNENVENKTRRSLRKRIHPADRARSDKDLAKIQKLNESVSDVHKYYLSKKVKRLPSTLETIYEEPKDSQNDMKQYISSRKFKRIIHFEGDLATANKLKVRKRQLKAKKLAFSKGFLSRKKVSMDSLMVKLSGVESDKE